MDRPASPPVLPRWVETGTGDLAILIREVAHACLIRYADRRGGYHWVDGRSLRRRPDLDAGPEPAWLAQARVSPRPPRVLWPLLHNDAPAHPPFDFETDADGRPLS